LPTHPGVRPDHVDRGAPEAPAAQEGQGLRAAEPRWSSLSRPPQRRAGSRPCGHLDQLDERRRGLGAGGGSADNGSMTGLTLGSLQVATPVVLAPMAGITNAAYRRLCAEQGAGLYVCEMITSRGVVERDRHTLDMLVFDELEAG